MELTHTLDFQLGMREGDSPLLRDGTLESRRVVNEVFCFDKEGWDWSDIDGAVVDRSDHVQNTTQRLVAKATTALLMLLVVVTVIDAASSWLRDYLKT